MRTCSKLLFFAIAMAALASCGEKKKESNNNVWQSENETETTTVTEEPAGGNEGVVWETAQNIYNEVLPQYAGDEAPDMGNLARQYCTEDFIELVRKTSKLERAKGEVGIDFDFWIMAQDYKNPTAKVTAVTMDGDDEATVDVEITNLDQTCNARLVMEKEHGVWKIDDFIDLKSDSPYSVKKAMKNYIGE